MTGYDADGTELVALSVNHAEAFHTLENGAPKCGVPIDFVTKPRDEAESRGYGECEHCTGDVGYGPGSRLIKRLLELDPDEVGV